MSARKSINAFFLFVAAFCTCVTQGAESNAAKPFSLNETTIEDIHRGIRAGEVTCKQVVRAYVARAQAYNGVCTKLVTANGAKAPKALGTTRAGAPLKFPTDTVSITTLVPDFDKYKGLPPDFGRMESTMSNPAVQQQYGMVVGIANAKQVNALETLNLRGERSVSCKKECDAATGALPSHCPAACDSFRRYPDALERAAGLDKQFGTKPDTKAIDPQYPDDPSIPNMAFTFQDALAEVIPFHMPEVLSWKKDGKPEFAVPGYDVSSRQYLVSAASHKAPWPANLNMRRMIGNLPADPEAVSGYQFSFNFAQYLLQRGDSRVYDWATLNANAKYHTDVRRAAMKNWENKPIDIRTEAVTYTVKRRDAVRMVMMKVLVQNKIDVFVNPSSTTLARKLGGPAEPDRRSYGYGATLGIPEVFVPAGFADTSYEPGSCSARMGPSTRPSAEPSRRSSQVRCRSTSGSGQVLARSQRC